MSENDAFMKPATLTFTRVCSCSVAGCIDCRSWITEADVPFHMQGPIMPAMANTVGVDMLRLLNQRYTIVTVIASAFEAPVVIQSIKENVAAAGLVNCFTGLRPEQPAQPLTQQAPTGQHPNPLQDSQVAARLGQCVEALTKAAQAMDKAHETVLPISKTTIVYDRRRYLQIYPIPDTRSWWRQTLLCWLSD
jgi:hypothetical protein